VRELRLAEGLDQQQLSARLAELGHPLPVSTISRIENGDRRADVGDLVAFALALRACPNELLLPTHHTEGEGGVQITENHSMPWTYAWAWARGELETPSPPPVDWLEPLRRTKDTPTRLAEARGDIRAMQRMLHELDAKLLARASQDLDPEPQGDDDGG
jgi:transcriptional regulator with XRE-family HTH domain